MSDTPECIRCQTAMELGFLVDHSHAVLRLGRWCAGKPDPSFWSGEMSRGQYKAATVVTTYRCPECGYLESYALTEE